MGQAGVGRGTCRLFIRDLRHVKSLVADNSDRSAQGVVPPKNGPNGKQPGTGESSSDGGCIRIQG